MHSLLDSGRDVKPDEAWPAGDADFEALFREHFDGVWRLLFRIVGARDEADDLAQEVFLRCWRHAGELRGTEAGATGADPPPLRPWLYRVASNLALNSLRDSKRLRRRHQEASMLEPASGRGPAPDDAVERESERRRVRAALARLPERQARLLLLRHSGLSYQELAEAVEVAPGSVGTLLARAEDTFAKVYRGMREGRR